MKISYAICTHNESESLFNLTEKINQNKDTQDEIVFLDDHSTNKVTKDFLKNQENVYYNHLNKNYANHKNILKKHCSGDYIFQIDADEYPTLQLFVSLKKIINKNPKVDLFRVPRQNYVNGILKEHIVKWRWSIDEKRRINYPDYQTRIFKNTNDIYWTRPVHEYITGFKIATNLPKDKNLDLIHKKEIQNQVKNNLIYQKNYNSDGSIKKT